MTLGSCVANAAFVSVVGSYLALRAWKLSYGVPT